MNEFSGLAQLISTVQPTGEPFDCIQGEGELDELPLFLIKSLRQIIYRLRISAMWSEENDIRIYLPAQREPEFWTAWARWASGMFADMDFRQMSLSNTLVIDGVTIHLHKVQSEIYPECCYLAVHSVGQNQLIFLDEKINRWLFRAPWAIARFEVKETEHVTP